MQNTALPFNPYGFFHKDLLIDFFIGIGRQPKIRDWADVRIYCAKQLLLKTVKNILNEGDSEKYGSKFTIFTHLRSIADYGDGLILISVLFSKK